MKKRWFNLILVLLFPTTLLAQSIHYDVYLRHPEKHFFQVEMHIQDISKTQSESLQVAIPAWCCLYQIRDFAQFVQDVRGTDQSSRRLPVQKQDKQTWQFPVLGARTVTISYRVFGNDLSPFGTQFNKRHAFINPALILFYVPSGRDWPVTVTYHTPPNWKILTAAESVPNKEKSFQAPSYDVLVDNPVEIGTFKTRSFESDGARYDVAFYNYRNSFSMNQFLEMLQRIVHYETVELMHDVPYKRYVFLFQVVDSYGSGMEHSNSCVISFNRARARGNVFDLASLIAHEFFHVWNVKRIKPKNLFRYDWTKENYTRALWFAEGGTNYYAALTRQRAGFWSGEELLSHFARRITQQENDPGRFIESPEQASFNCWFEKYPWYVRPENSISYYRSGEILAFLLDLKIRLDTHNRFSLDDVMRTMNGLFAKRQMGYNDSDDILTVINSLTGKDYSDFFEHFIAGTDRPPYEEIFEKAGLQFKKIQESVPEPGFTAERNFDQPFVVTSVRKNSPAAKAGLQVDDRVLKVNGLPTGLYIEDSFQNLTKGASVDLLIQRGGKSIHIVYRLSMKKREKFVLRPAKNQTDFQKSLQKNWLEGLPK